MADLWRVTYMGEGVKPTSVGAFARHVTAYVAEDFARSVAGQQDWVVADPSGIEIGSKKSGGPGAEPPNKSGGPGAEPPNKRAPEPAKTAERPTEPKPEKAGEKPPEPKTEKAEKTPAEKAEKK